MRRLAFAHHATASKRYMRGFLGLWLASSALPIYPTLHHILAQRFDMLTPFHLLVSFLALTSTCLGSPRHGMITSLTSLALQRRQTGTCSSDPSCTSASTGLTKCTSGSSSSNFLSCFCTSYAQDLLTCYENGCFDGTDLQPSAEYVLESCALYATGDSTTANACLSSADPTSTSCQAALNDNTGGTSTGGTGVASSSVSPTTPTYTSSTIRSASTTGLGTTAQRTTSTSSPIVTSGSAQMLDRLHAASTLCLVVAAALAVLYF